MRIHAYVLAADPAWLEASVLSYYELVDCIVVSYDADGRSWTDTPIPVDECLRRLKAIDRDNKMVLAPGHFSRETENPMDNETRQRQVALDQAGEGADWVLQIDTDEVLADPATFLACLQEADARGDETLCYPLRPLFCRLKAPWYLEIGTRFWGVRGEYPGAMAVRPGLTLRLARGCDRPTYWVGFRNRPQCDRYIRAAQGIYHYSWIRDDAYMERKSKWSGHARDFDWRPLLARWRRSQRHPFLDVALTPLRRGPITLRFARTVFAGGANHPSAQYAGAGPDGPGSRAGSAF